MFQQAPSAIDSRSSQGNFHRPAALAEGVALLVVDEPFISRMLLGVFVRAGMNVLWLGGLDRSLDFLRERRIDVSVAFVDCRQSGSEGSEFCRSARAIRPGLTVLLAGHGETQEAVAALVADGPTVHVPKPYLPTELAWQMRSHLVPAQARPADPQGENI